MRKLAAFLWLISFMNTLFQSGKVLLLNTGLFEGAWWRE
jgi:hypothetical protein